MKKDSIISYDFWGTLCKSNPDFKNAQNELAKKLFNFDSIKFQTRKGVIKEAVDEAVEKYGFHFNRKKIYMDIFQTTSLSTIEEFIKKSDKLFLEFPPIQLIEMVPNISGVVSSNTVLIYGDIMYKVIRKYFEPVVCNFSDELGLSKPRKEMFRFKVGEVFAHVGDNPKTDGACEKEGIKFVHISEYNNFKSQLKYL